MAGKARSEEFKTPRCRVSYARDLFTPRAKTDDAGKPTGKEAYGCTLIFQKSVDRKALNAAVESVVLEEWGEKGIDRFKKGLIKSPFIDGMSKSAHNKAGDLNPGMGDDVFFVRVTANNEPTVRYRSANIPAKHGNGPDDIKSGDFGFAVLNAFAWNSSTGGDGVSFGISYFQKLEDGESLGGTGGGVDVDKYFEKVADTGAAPDETKSGAGASGLFG